MQLEKANCLLRVMQTKEVAMKQGQFFASCRNSYSNECAFCYNFTFVKYFIKFVKFTFVKICKNFTFVKFTFVKFVKILHL